MGDLLPFGLLLLLFARKKDNESKPKAKPSAGEGKSKKTETVPLPSVDSVDVSEVVDGIVSYRPKPESLYPVRQGDNPLRLVQEAYKRNPGNPDNLRLLRRMTAVPMNLHFYGKRLADSPAFPSEVYAVPTESGPMTIACAFLPQNDPMFLEKLRASEHPQRTCGNYTGYYGVVWIPGEDGEFNPPAEVREVLSEVYGGV